MAVLKEKYLDRWIGKQHNWCYGKLVELSGNLVRLEGCTFSLDNPYLAIKIKSGFLFGNYETPERDAIQRFLDPELPVIEFGGSIGVVSCITNRKLINPLKHVVVEANPALVPVLTKNRNLNKCGFEILPGVVAYGSESAPFYANAANFLVGSSIPSDSSPTDIVQVKTTNLLSILDQFQFERCTLICDIEGGEAALLRHESDVLRERVSTLILEVHESFLGTEGVGVLLADIERLGFRKIHSNADTYVFRMGQVLTLAEVPMRNWVTKTLNNRLASSFDQQQGAAEVSNC